MNYYKKKTSIYMKIHIKYVLYYLNAFHTIFNSSMRGPFSSTESSDMHCTIPEQIPIFQYSEHECCLYLYQQSAFFVKHVHVIGKIQQCIFDSCQLKFVIQKDLTYRPVIQKQTSLGNI